MNPWCIEVIDMINKYDLNDNRPKAQKDVESAIWKDMLAGCAGGLAGGWTMAQFTRVWKTLSGSSIELLPYSRQEWEAVSGIAEIAAHRIFRGRLSERQKMTGAILVHYAMAAAAGALYGTASARTMPKKIKGAGALFGIAMWMLGNEFLMPVLRLTSKPSDYSLPMQANALGEHIVYGLTTDRIYQVVKKFL